MDGVDLRASINQNLSRCAANGAGHHAAAQSAITRRLKELRVPFESLVVGGLFAATTAAAGSYGCEIWATPFLSGWHLLTNQCRLHGYQAAVYKRSLGLPRSTANLPFLRCVGTRCRCSGWPGRCATGTS
jgi:hypothetical protein